MNIVCIHLLDVLLRPDIFIQGILKLRHHIDTETYGKVAMAIL